MKKTIETAGRLGNLTLRVISGLMAAVFLIMGGLALWDMVRTEMTAFVSYDLLKYRPDIEKKEPPFLDELIEMNPDACAWISIYGTNIDYPVFQGKNDMAYINKDAFGEYSISGSIFLSVLNKRDFSGPYQLIYGHHMENGSMFGDLDKFKEREFMFNENGNRCQGDEGVLILPGKAYDLHALAFMITDCHDEMIYRADKTETDVKELLTYAKEKAMFMRDPGKVRHILALSTCGSGSADERMILLLKVSPREKPLPSRETGKTTAKYKAVGHPLSGRYWSFLDLAILFISLLAAFPFHHIKELRIREQWAANIFCAVSGLGEAVIFFMTQDLTRPIKVTDPWTFPMLVIACLITSVRSLVLKRSGREQNIPKGDNHEKY